MKEERKFTQMLLISIFIHAVLVIIFSITYKKPLILSPKSVTVKFANINEVKVHDVLKERAKQRQSSLKKFVDKTKNIIKKKSKPKKTYEEIKQEKRKNLEKLLKEIDEPQSQPSQPKAKETPLLNSQDMPVDINKTGQQRQDNQAQQSHNSGANLLLENPNRKIEYLPPQPRYPQWALDNGIQGVTKIKVWFDKDGFAVDAQIVKSSGNSRLDIVAKNYVLQFKIEPIDEDKEETGVISVSFSINQ